MRATLDSLFNRYHRELLSFISRKFGNHHDAEDIIQDTFHTLLRAKDIAEIENPRAYLYKAATNLALNRIRSEQRYNARMLELAASDDEFEMNELSPEQFSVAHQELSHLQAALSKLAPKYQKTFLLNRVEGKSYKEISEELAMPVSTVEKHMIKALTHLRKHQEYWR